MPPYIQLVQTHDGAPMEVYWSTVEAENGLHGRHNMFQGQPQHLKYFHVLQSIAPSGLLPPDEDIPK